jgi:sugar O-acyltransferase (sialic acid O-acetyltransferase NeuD family)
MFLYGASGHGKVVREIVESQGLKVDGFIDDNTAISELAGLPVKHRVDDDDEVIVSIGVNSTRKKVAERLKDRIAAAAIHRTVVVSRSATLGYGTVVMAGAIINAEARIGRHCIVNTGASIDHECVLGDYVHVSPHATLCGDVTVGEGAWIGAGTTVIQGVKIGRWAVIGAGSVVTKDIPDGVVAYGNPCRVIRQVNTFFPT